MGRSTRFTDDLPGPDFTKGFLKRHLQLTVRVAHLIKRSRAAVSHYDVHDFFERFEKAVADIPPPQNLWNYDETNMRDNLGDQQTIFQKSVKYAKQVRDHSKSSISMMYCYNALAESVPPFFLYKGQNVHPSWYRGGLKKAVYMSSSPRWFDTFTFEECFNKVFLPVVHRQPGKKMLLGDNLASHLSMEVTTNKMQPLGSFHTEFFVPVQK